MSRLHLSERFDLTVDTRMVRSGGIGTWIKGVLPHLCERFRVLQVGEAVVPGVPCRAFRAPLFSVSEQIGLSRLLRDISPRLHLHPHYTIPLLYRGDMAAVIHDVIPLAVPGYLRGLHARVYAYVMFRAAVRRPKAVFTVSDFSRDEIIRCVGRGRAAVHVVHNGVRECFRPVRREEQVRVRLRLSLPENFVLFVGNVKPHKNVERIVRALALVPDISLVVVGQRDGFVNGLPWLGDLLREERLEERVHFTGYLDDADLPPLYSAARALVFPSLYEGFGFPPLEAMACGTPAIVSRHRLSDEVYGDAGIAVDPRSVKEIADGLRLVLDGGENVESFRKRGLCRAAGFTWQRSAEHIADVLEKTL